jgi:glutaredoxin 3
MKPDTIASVKMYATRFCPYCMRARSLLSQKGVPFEDISVDADPALRAQMMAESGRHTVPQIWVGDTHVGGFDELWTLEQRGELDALLQPA